MSDVELAEAFFVKGKLHKQAQPVLRVTASTGRGQGWQYLQTIIPVDDVVAMIVQVPALRMRLLAALLVEEAKRVATP